MREIWAVLNVVSCRLKAQFDNAQAQELIKPEKIGHVIPVCCGHTGHPSSEEAYLMELHLRAANLIKMPIKDPNTSTIEEKGDVSLENNIMSNVS